MNYIDQTKPTSLAVPFSALKVGDTFIVACHGVDAAVFFKGRPLSLYDHNARRFEGNESVNFDQDERVIKVIVTSITYERVKA